MSFCLFLFAIVLSVLRFTVSDYPFDLEIFLKILTPIQKHRTIHVYLGTKEVELLGFFKIHYLLSDKMKLFNAAIFLFSSYAVCRFWLQIGIYIKTKHNCLNKRNLSTVFRNVLSLAYGVVVLTPLSTIFQLYNLYASLTFNVMLRFNVKCDLFKSHL